MTLPKTYYPNRLKLIALLLVSLLFTVVGFFMAQEGGWQGWAALLFFGLCSIVFVIQLLPSSSYLKVDELGFEVCSLFRKHRVAWYEVGGFGTYRQNRMTMVGYNMSEHYHKAASGRKLAVKLTGFEGALPDTYGMKADELAKVMNKLMLQYANRG